MSVTAVNIQVSRGISIPNYTTLREENQRGKSRFFKLSWARGILFNNKRHRDRNKRWGGW
jgi:hypothetical protein